jgi:hypothetical protein
MLSLLPIHRVAAAIAVSYTAAIVVVLSIFCATTPAPSLREIVSIVFAGATILQFALLACFTFGWKIIWRIIPGFNNWLFPNLNGEWEMTIHWRSSVDDFGEIPAKAFIRQNFLRISLEVSSKNSDSETLVAVPKRDPESGRPILHYQYRVIPKNLDGKFSQTYLGAAILKFTNSVPDELHGNYFTSVRTDGHFVMKRA